jgi:citrate synthase
METSGTFGDRGLDRNGISVIPQGICARSNISQGIVRKMNVPASAVASGGGASHVVPQCIEAVICSALGVAPSAVTEDLAYQSISEWDSMGHVVLMQALEKAYATRIGGTLVSQLTSMRALRTFVGQLSGDPRAAPATAAASALPTIHRGLVGVCVDRSAITDIDPSGSVLRYRGYNVAELAARASYEETAFLLVHGRLPDRVELGAFSRALRLERALPAPVLALLASMSKAPPFLALQAAVAALGAFSRDDADIALIAQVPVMLGIFHGLRTGRAPLAPREDLGHTENLLYLLSGEVPDRLRSEALDEAFVLLADHGSSASTFTARVVTGTNAGIHAALSSAIAAFSGPLHGGAVNEVIAMAEEIGSPAAAAAFVQGRVERKEVVYGFGHRVYRTADPRSRPLHAIARRLCREGGDARILEILEAVAAALADYGRLGLDINVDFYASAVFEALRIPRDLFGPVFAAARMAGLVAHVREQRGNNVLIRPQLFYSGEPARTYPKYAAP